MTKIPVFRTVADAYVFTFNNLGVIAGLIWIPMLALTLLGFFAETTYMDGMIAFDASKNPSDALPGVMWMLLLVFISLLALALMMVPVLQQALGTRKDHPFAHFALGQPEWRLFSSYLALLGVVFTVAIVLVVLSGLFSRGILTIYPGAATAPAVDALLQLIGLVLILGLAAAFVRLMFFIPAVAIVEEKVDLTRGWRLAQGNVLRLIAVIVLLAIPVALLDLAFEAAVFGWNVAASQSMQASAVDIQLLRQKLPLTQAFGFFIAPLTIGLNAGAVASVYRALVQGARPELPPQ
jgi:hypothetical protein